MAYSKTTWVDNVTDIDKDNLNKIEQGIYDNSLVVDAVTNTLNPTDTETYKTAELTEGQITDVIGVNNILIKGQTSQNGEPTPDSPIDVNVVSGSNVVNTSNKNLFDKDTKDFSKGYYLNNEGVEQAGENWGVYYIRVEPNKVYSISGCQTNGGVSFCWFNKNKTFISYIGNKQNRNNMTAPNNAYYLGLSVVWNITSSAYDNNIMLEQSSTATTYEPHQGKELPLDLPVENLFDKDNVTNGGFYTTSVVTNANWCYINTTSLIQGKTYFVNKRVILSFWNGTDHISYVDKNNTTFAVPEGTTNTYISTLLTNKETLQLEFGSKANVYTPYGTDSIELCKIGDYQDYFYKSGSKWYLHKEVGKFFSNSTSDWRNDGNDRYYYIIDMTNIVLPANNNTVGIGKSNIGLVTANQTLPENNGKGIAIHTVSRIYISEDVYNNIAVTPTLLYYAHQTPINTEITDTTLISQLEAIYNAPLYEQTNITQTNNDLPMVLDITACKDNINGIKAFIRK